MVKKKQTKTMIFVQFYQKSAIANNDGISKLIPATGDRSVIIYDGRLKGESSKELILKDAQMECYKREYLGFQLFIGKSLLKNAPLSVLQIPESVNMRELDISEIGGVYNRIPAEFS